MSTLTSDTAATGESSRAKRIRLYRNGDDCMAGKTFVVNRRRIRTWDAFLRAVTVDVKSNEAVRSIRTPRHGSRVETLDQLQDQRQYVAVAAGGFKKLGYEEQNGLPHLPKVVTPRNADVKPVVHSRILQSGRIRKVTTDVICINVYSNGNELEPPRRVKLQKRMLPEWNLVISEINEKVGLCTGAVRRLYTLEGQLVSSALEMKTGDNFVAVGVDTRSFKKIEYLASKPAFNNSPKRESSSQRRDRMITLPGTHRRRGAYRSHASGASDQTTSTRYTTKTSSPNHATDNASSKYNPRPPAQRKGSSPKKDDVFHAKDKNRRPSDQNIKEINYDKDDGGLYRAQGKKIEAEEVEDTVDTKVELTLDQQIAEQVEEEIDGSDPIAEEINDEIVEEEEDEGKEEAAIRIQANYRGYKSRKVTKKHQQDITEAQAATEIQSGFRGYKGRQKAHGKREEKAAVKIQSNYRGYDTRKKISKYYKHNKEDEILDEIAPESEDLNEPEEETPSIRPISGISQADVVEDNASAKETSRPTTVRESPIERNISGKTINGTTSPVNANTGSPSRENSRVASRVSSRVGSVAESRNSSRAKSRTESLVPTPPEIPNSNSRPESRRSQHSNSPEAKSSRSHVNSVSQSRAGSVRSASRQSLRANSETSERASSVQSERVASVQSERAASSRSDKPPSSRKSSRSTCRPQSTTSRHSPVDKTDDADVDTGAVEEEETESKYTVNQPKDELD